MFSIIMRTLQFNSMRHKMMVAFAVLTAIIIFITSISYYSLLRVERVTLFSNSVNQLENASLILVKMDLELLTTQSRNEAWFLKGSFPEMESREAHFHQLVDQLNQLNMETADADMPNSNNLDQLEKSLVNYNEVYRKITQKQLLRGFRDYGLEGKMRSYAHAMENYTPWLSLSEVLSLRRHEKDYFLRKDDRYTVLLNDLSAQLQERLTLSKENIKANTLLFLLKEYTTTYNKIVVLEKEIGQESQEGMRGQLTKLSRVLTADFENYAKDTQNWASDYFLTLKMNFGLTGLLCVLVGLLLSYVLSDRFARPIKRLSVKMDKFLLENSDQEPEIQMSESSHEINRLVQSYVRMTRQLRKQYHEIREKGKVLEEQNDELKKLNFEIDQFVYSAAHDFRAPLSSLLGLMNLMRLETKEPQLFTYLDMMETSIKKVDFFIQDILNYSQNKSLELEINPVDLKEMVEAIYATNRFSIESKNIILTYQLPSEEEIFFSDKKRVMIVLNNLLSNSIRYFDSSKYQPRIHLKVEVNDNEAHFEVIDNGIGIPLADQQKIFQMFYRASATSNGSGLGLFIVQETVFKLGGTISVESKEGASTIFRFTLPNKQDYFLEQIHQSLVALESVT